MRERLVGQGRRTRRFALLGAALLLLLPVACGSDDDDDVAAPTDSPPADSAGEDVAHPDEFKIAMVGAAGSPLFALMYVAEGIGAFEEEIEEPFGVPVELTFGLSSSDAVAALASGEVQATGRGFVGAAAAMAQDAPVKAVGTFFEGLAAMVVAHTKYEAERGTDVTKFVDSVWGTGSPGGVGEIAVRGLLEKEGIDFSEIETVNTGDVPLQRSLLESGDIDLVASDTTTASVMIQEGLAYLLFNTMDPEANVPVLGKQIGTFILVGESFEEDYPEFATAFYRALGRAWLAIDEARDDAQAVLDLYSADVRERLNEDAFLAEWPQVQASIHPVSMSGEYLEDTVDAAMDAGLLTEADWDAVKDRFDEELLFEVYDDLGVEVVRG